MLPYASSPSLRPPFFPHRPLTRTSLLLFLFNLSLPCSQFSPVHPFYKPSLCLPSFPSSTLPTPFHHPRSPSLPPSLPPRCVFNIFFVGHKSEYSRGCLAVKSPARCRLKTEAKCSLITCFPQHTDDHSPADNTFLSPLDLWTGKEIWSRLMTNVRLPLYVTRRQVTGFRKKETNNYGWYVTGKNVTVSNSFMSGCVCPINLLLFLQDIVVSLLTRLFFPSRRGKGIQNRSGRAISFKGLKHIAIRNF